MLRYAHQFRISNRKPNIALIGPASCGKTMFARIYAKSLGVDFIEIQPHALKTMSDIYDIIVEKVGRSSLVRQCVVMIDEVHNLSKYIEQGLLQAVEKGDCRLETEQNLLLFTSNISWVIATTEWGQLFGPFKTRFNRVSLRLYSKTELAKIVQLVYPCFDADQCEMIAFYTSLPRESLSFAEEIVTALSMSPDEPLRSIMERVADDSMIDKYGMTFKRVEALTELGTGPVAKSRLAGMIGVQTKELENDIMPPLLCKTSETPNPQVSVCSKGYYITYHGLLQLILRGIDNIGLNAIPQSLWSRYSQFWEDEKEKVA